VTAIVLGLRGAVRRLIDAVLLVSVGGMLGMLVGLFSTIGALLVPGLVAVAAMLAIPYSGLYATVAIVPVNVMITDQITVTRLVVVAALAVTAFQAFTRRTPMPRLFVWPEGVAAIAFFGAIVASAVAFGLSGLLSRVGPYIIYAAIFFLVLNQAADPVRLRRLLWIILIVGLLQTVLVIAEARFNFVPFGGWHAELAERRGADEVRVVGTHAHPILLAGFYQVAIAIAVGLALTARTRGLALLLFAAAAFLGIGWWYTFARSSWIGMAVMLGAFMLVASRGTRALALVGGFVAFVVLAIYDFSPSAIIRDIESLTVLRSSAQLAGVAAGAESLTWRLENWTAAVNMFLENPLFGVGLEQSRLVTFEYLPRGATAHHHIATAEPHNMFLQIAAEAGGLALFAFVGLWVLAFRAVGRAAGDPTLRPYALLVFTMMAGLLAMFSLNPMPREVWLVLALAFALGRMRRRSGAAAGPAAASGSRPGAGEAAAAAT
jgi:O-antigen ligase